MNPIDLAIGLLIGLGLGALLGHLIATRRQQAHLARLQQELAEARAALAQAQALHDKDLEALRREHAATLAAKDQALENERARHQAERQALEKQHHLALEAERRTHAEALQARDEAYARLKETIEKEQEQLREAFAALSREALKDNNDAFLKLAEQQLKKLHQQAKDELEKKEKSVAHLVQPIRETLQKTERQLQELEKERKRQEGELFQRLRQLSEQERELQRETQRLVNALRRPEVRGQWGEITLHRLVELAGLVDHVDFTEQESATDDADRRLRPDMIVHLPNERCIVVDAKAPLDAYLTAMEQDDEDARESALRHHARKVRERVKELSSKAYWNHIDGSIDFVVLFIPGEQFLGAALERDRTLLEYALENRVILATPTTLVALLRAVAFGWRQEALAENAERIRQEGEALYQRLATFAEHLAKVGKGLNQSVSAYNQAVGSYSGRLLPAAQRLTELGIHPGKKAVPTLDTIDRQTRELPRDPGT